MLTALTLSLTHAALAAVPPQIVDAELVASGGMKEIGYYRPVRLELSPDRPASITRLPAEVTAPLFATLDIDAGDGRHYHVVLNEPDGAPSTLYVDANANGDLTDDPEAEWTWELKEQTDGPARSMARGSFQVDLTPDADGGLVSMGAYRFDKNDPAREQLKTALLFYRDYALKGHMSLAGKTYPFHISDEGATGDLRKGELLIDVNANGKIDSRGERFPLDKPFNIAGTTYQLTLDDRLGSSLHIAESDQQVAEVLPPPNHAVGQTITPFKATTTDGKAIDFPADYKGKIVMIDFWATWCGPCMAEVPGLVKAYQQHHDQGFEVLGISLDNERSAEKMPAVMQQHNMTWPQVCDKGGWDAAIADLYGVSSIPHTLLIDASTGKILAAGNDLRGDKLDQTIRKALDARPRVN